MHNPTKLFSAGEKAGQKYKPNEQIETKKLTYNQKFLFNLIIIKHQYLAE